MRATLIVITLFLVAGMLTYLEPQRATDETKVSIATESEKLQQSISTPLRFSLPSTKEVKLQPIADEAELLNSEDSSCLDDVALLESVLRQYRNAFGQHPVGINSEIIAALAGRNCKSVAFISPENVAINEDGQLVDRWGSPFFFHQESALDMKIISPGPDRILFNADDVQSGEQ